ncbi:SurA N-terminal domain-containing protein [Pengzhenrongella sicca]|uniref:SurA N-terminal domain-containing protein n=1 Tax=Pengzhenrongella sicca TaxID=2819238 RepID=A0A8A4ZGX0_9MICO|nr:SurA N-terminal domain-containing protein [Pengzhenrongella sicca]QTE28888.1 hypothetical protein J4E96_16400 [Pengzhenrongella sicca]
MTVRSPLRRRAVPVLLMAGALVVGSLSGCSGQPGAAAVVDGEAIPVAELQDATSDLSPFFQDVTQGTILMVLVVAPTFVQAAEDAGVGVSTSQAKEALEQTAASAVEAGDLTARTTPFSDAAIEVIRFTLIQTNLTELADDDVTAQITADLADLDAEVNPRYGEADFSTWSVTPVTAPWLVETAPAE